MNVQQEVAEFIDERISDPTNHGENYPKFEENWECIAKPKNSARMFIPKKE